MLLSKVGLSLTYTASQCSSSTLQNLYLISSEENAGEQNAEENISTQKKDVRKDWRKLHIEELYNLSVPDTIMTIKSRTRDERCSRTHGTDDKIHTYFTLQGEGLL
jgi:hypothetical protein